MKIENAKALVTGGGSGIGFEIAKELRARGAAVVICGRDQVKLERAAKEIGAIAITADVSVEGDVVRLVRDTISTLSGLDIVINNAGFGYWSLLTEMSLERMKDVFATNVFGAMLVAREASRHFVQQDHGNIVNIASTASQRGYAGGTAYAASKFALAGMTECWRAELRKNNVRVMQVNPSEVQTDFFARSGRDQKPSNKKLRAVEIAHAVCSMLEMDDRGFITDLSVWATNPE